MLSEVRPGPDQSVWAIDAGRHVVGRHIVRRERKAVVDIRRDQPRLRRRRKPVPRPPFILDALRRRSLVMALTGAEVEHGHATASHALCPSKRPMSLMQRSGDDVVARLVVVRARCSFEGNADGRWESRSAWRGDDSAQPLVSVCQFCNDAPLAFVRCQGMSAAIVLVDLSDTKNQAERTSSDSPQYETP
jgi:hypothetical protein